MERFDEILERLEASGALLNERNHRRFQTLCCRYIWKVLPEPARHALTIAEAFAAGEVSAPRLVEERVALWKYLGKRSCDFASPGVNAVRAVICCLFETFDPSEGYESATHVVEFCDDALGEAIPYSDLLRLAFDLASDGSSGPEQSLPG